MLSDLFFTVLWVELAYGDQGKIIILWCSCLSLSIPDPARDQPLLFQIQAKEPASFPSMPRSLSAQQIELLYRSSSPGTYGWPLFCAG